MILARYSTDNQNPDSIEVQVDKCTEWRHQKRIPILGVFADMAVSGMKDTRPQYEAMMQQLRQGKADTVVIYDQSRMFRKMTAWLAFRDELSAMGVSVVSVTQPMIGKDLRDPTNFLAEGSMALFNQIWALQTRQKVMEKMRFMARNGQHTGGKPPLGYSVEDGRLVICEEEAAVVRRIFAEYAGGKTYRDIIAGLNKDGLKTKKEQFLYFLHKFRVLDISKQSHRQRLIDTFINRIYLYDDKLVITFNHKDGAETITLNDIEAALADVENGSDLVSFAVPKPRYPFGYLGFCHSRRIFPPGQKYKQVPSCSSSLPPLISQI